MKVYMRNGKFKFTVNHFVGAGISFQIYFLHSTNYATHIKPAIITLTES